MYFSAYEVVPGDLASREAGRAHFVQAVIRITACTKYTRIATRHPNTPDNAINAEKSMQ